VPVISFIGAADLSDPIPVISSERGDDRSTPDRYRFLSPVEMTRPHTVGRLDRYSCRTSASLHANMIAIL
jgi:hypothetical protein